MECFQLFTLSYRLATCQNWTNKPIACISICLLYFNYWDAISLSPFLVQMKLRNSCKTAYMEEEAFSQRHDTTLQWGFGLLCLLANLFNVSECVLWIYSPYAPPPIPKWGVFLLVECVAGVKWLFIPVFLNYGVAYLWKLTLNFSINWQVTSQIYFWSHVLNLFLMELDFKIPQNLLLLMLKNQCLTAKIF